MRLRFYADGVTQVAEVIHAKVNKEDEALISLANGKTIRVRRCKPLDIINQLYKIGYFDIVEACMGGWAEYIWIPDKEYLDRINKKDF